MRTAAASRSAYVTRRILPTREDPERRDDAERRDDTRSAVTSIRQLVRVLRVAAQRTQTATGITAAGLRVQRRTTEAPMTSLIAGLRKLSEQELSVLATSLRLLTDALGAS